MAEMKLMAKSISIIQGELKKNWKWKAVDRIWYVVEIKTQNTFLY